MAQSTVAQFAAELGRPVSSLLEQLKNAGVNKDAVDDILSEADKTALLDYLRKEHGAAAPRSKITLTRKQSTEIKKTDSAGRARTIQVEVRKKRVLMRRDDVAEPLSEAKMQEDASAQQALDEEQPAVVQEPIIEEEVIAPVIEQQPIAVEAPSARKIVLSAEEIALREREAKRAATLAAMQAEDLRRKQELEARRVAEDEARKSAEAEKKVGKLSEGTLHKPTKEGSAKPEGKEAKKGKGADNRDWNENENRKRGLKARGDVGMTQGWRAPKTKHKHKDDEQQHAFNAPTEPIVHEIAVPETISVADLAHKMSVKASEVIKALMKMGMMVTINPVSYTHLDVYKRQL